MARFKGRGGGFALLGLVSVGCGGGDESFPADPLEVRTVVIRPAAPAPVFPAQGEAAPGPAQAPGAAGPGAELGEGGGAAGPGAAAVDPDVCTTPLGVSGTPRTLQEAMVLMNSLPRPTSLACFLQALSRPLELYLTSSNQSLQPSPGARSPRTFIVFEPLVMSIVFDGPAHVALELGYRTTATRSIKTEITFPLDSDVTYDNFFDEVEIGTRTRCGACHIAEVQTLSPEFPVDVFESDIIPPFDNFVVDVESLRAERQSCDSALEADRCELLSALFDHGTVRAAPEGILF